MKNNDVINLLIKLFKFINNYFTDVNNSNNEVNKVLIIKINLNSLLY